MKSLRRFGVASILGVGVGVALTGLAKADVIPSASYYEIAQITTGGQTSIACSPDGCPGVGGVTFGSTALGAVAFGNVMSSGSTPLTLSATASSTGTNRALGAADALYYFEWVGPSGSAPIPTFVDLNLHVAATADPNDFFAGAGAIAGFGISLNDITPINPTAAQTGFISCSAGGSYISAGNHTICDSTDFDGTLVYSLQPNVIYTAELDVNVSSGGFEFNSPATTPMSAQASADPRIYTSPDSPYVLELSPDIDNALGNLGDNGGGGGGPTNSVPEASSMMLFASAIAGFALLRGRHSAQRVSG